METLRPFQDRFLAAATAPGIDCAALSLPRGNGKSWLAARLAIQVLSPGDALFRSGTESVLCAASIEQSRIVFRFVREFLEPMGGYRFLDSFTRCAVTHKPTNTRLRVLGSNGKTAFGLVGCPGAWETNGGQLLHDAIETAKGKPGSPLRSVYIGTMAPATGGWWHDMIEAGSHGSTYVQVLQGDRKTWDQWATIRKANPLTSISADFRKKLLEERDAAREDSRLKARFCSFRLNLPTSDESEILLSVDDWERVTSRDVPPRDGLPVFSYDLGGGRSWSAAVALWRNGRTEALAVAPGVPSLEDQEKRDKAPAGLYRRLEAGGRLLVADGVRVPSPALLHGAAVEAWGGPEIIMCDRFRFPELADSVNGTRLIPRVTTWSEASEDIRGLRKLAADGPLSVAAGSRERPGLPAVLSSTGAKIGPPGASPGCAVCAFWTFWRVGLNQPKTYPIHGPKTSLGAHLSNRGVLRYVRGLETPATAIRA